jgi:hypothetical protein
MRPCKTCVHPEILSIDAALLAGESGRSVARRFGLSVPAVQRHVNRDLVQMPTPGGRTPHEPTGAPTGETSALDEMRALVKSLKETPTAGLSPVVQMAIAREKRLAVVELAKIAPPPPPNGGIDWSQSQEWTEFACFWEDWIVKQDPALLVAWRLACREYLVAQGIGEQA